MRTPIALSLLLLVFVAIPCGAQEGPPASPLPASSPERAFSLFPEEEMARRAYLDSVREPAREVEPARPTPSPWPEHASVRGVMSWLMDVSQDDASLGRVALVAMALIAALLTVIATWEVTPATRPSTPVVPQKAEDKTAAPEKPPSLLGPFQGNFGRTVLSGLGGLAAVSFVEDSLWKDSGINAKGLYIVLFVGFFLAFLLISAVYQGVVEALRSRILVVNRPPEWRPRRVPSGAPANPWDDAARGATPDQSFFYWMRGAKQWMLSWRYPGLVFLDTVFNVVQGRNQLQTAGFSRDLLNLHWSQVWVACRIREEIDRAIVRALKKAGVPPLEADDIRVNVAVLSEDEQTVSYISWERGSLGKSFDKRSLAWLSIFSGTPLWHKKRYSRETVVLENHDGKVPMPEPEITLGNCFQGRSSDYDAFVILPLPWMRRGETREYQKAGILISFRKEEYLDALWEGLETGAGKPGYERAKDVLSHKAGATREPAVPELASLGVPRLSRAGELEAISLLEAFAALGEPAGPPEPTITPNLLDPELASLLRLSVEVLTESLRYFNPTVFREQILPHLHT